MKKEIIKQLSLWITLICWLTFLLLHAFTRLTCFENHQSIWEYLISAITTLAYTLFLCIFYGNLKSICSDNAYPDILDNDLYEDYVFNSIEDDSNKKKFLQNSLLTVFIFSTLFLVSLALEMWVADFTFFTDSTYISIGRHTINKKNLYDPFLFITFPLMIQLIFKGMTEEHYNWKSVLSGSFQIIALSLMAFLLFMKLPNIWLIELAIISLITIILAIYKYTWKNIKQKKLSILFIFFYAGFWIGLLGLFNFSKYSFTEYTYGNNWNSYSECVHTLFKNAAFFGTSPELQSNPTILEFLQNHNNYLHSILYYFGWSVALPLIGFFIAFLISTKALLGKYGIVHKNHLMYQTTWWTLALRVFIGIPYSLGFLPLPIGIPLSNSLSLYTDTIAITLLLYCAWENKKIHHLLSYNSMKSEKYLPDVEGIIVTQADSTTLYEMPMKGIYEENDEDEEILKKYNFWNDDEVIYKCGNIEIPCTVRWYGYSTRKFATFEPIDKNILEYFILEHFPDTGKWIALNNERLHNLISYAYLQRYVPECYEDIEDMIH